MFSEDVIKVFSIITRTHPRAFSLVESVKTIIERFFVNDFMTEEVQERYKKSKVLGDRAIYFSPLPFSKSANFNASVVDRDNKQIAQTERKKKNTYPYMYSTE